jgi:uncharacterized protein YbjT (DUF2867 family)
MKTAVIAGATGLIGKQLLEKLLTSERYHHVIALTRSALPLTNPKLQTIITNFRDLTAVLSGARADDVFCCLGTTMAKAGSKQKFYEVDFEYPLALAQTMLTLGARQYLLVSALGADPTSSIYYNKVKGEIEGAIRALDFETIHIFRPSLLLGPRSEKRPGEDVAKVLYKVFGFVIPQKYKAIQATTVAAAMLAFASKDLKGTYIHESGQLQET